MSWDAHFLKNYTSTVVVCSLNGLINISDKVLGVLKLPEPLLKEPTHPIGSLKDIEVYPSLGVVKLNDGTLLKVKQLKKKILLC